MTDKLEESNKRLADADARQHAWECWALKGSLKTKGRSQVEVLVDMVYRLSYMLALTDVTPPEAEENK